MYVCSQYFQYTDENLDELVYFASGGSAASITTQQVPTQLELAKQWLGSCLSTHKTCRISAKEHFRLPTRLIDVNSEDVRLVTTENWKEQPRYATLSHCWGKLNFTKLRKELVESFMTSIPLEILTTTFNDAIKITQSLGLRYLWIDSLCII